MSRADSPTQDVEAPRPSRRWWFPIAAIVAAAITIFAIGQLPPDSVDRGMRVIYRFVAIVVALAMIGVWFFTFARFSRRARWLGAATIIALSVLSVASVRRVEFSGDMDPTFDLRWLPDRDKVLEAHRTAHRDAGGLADRPAADSDHPARPLGCCDVLEFRGARRDGTVDGPRLSRDWAQRPPKLVWRQPVGGGYASFVVDGPLAITIEQRRDREAVVAYDVDTGRERWVYDYPALFSEKLGGDGPRATPTIHQDKVYSLGATGVLSCVQLTNGQKLWSVNILETNGAGNLDWGMAGSPLIHERLVVVNPGSQKGTSSSRAVTTFAAEDGSPRWGAGAAKAGYTSPMLVALDGVQQFLNFDGEGLAGIDALNREELWRVPWKSDFDINAAQPVVLDENRVLITSSTGTAVVRLTSKDGAWTTDVQWKNRKLRGGYTSPIVYGNNVFGIDESILVCLDVETGKQLWKERAGQYGHGQILRCDDLLVILAETGELALVEATGERFSELGRIQAIDGKTWNNPTMVGGRIFVRNHLEMAAYDLPTDAAREHRESATP